MEQDRDSRFIVATVVLGDLVILNVIYYLISLMGFMPHEMDLLYSHVIITLSYIVSVTSLGGVKMHQRHVRTDQIITTVLGNIIGFFIVWLIMRAVLGFSVSPSWEYFIFASLIFIFVTAYRLLYQLTLRSLRSQGGHVCSVVFVGSTRNILDLYEEMTLNLHTGYRVLGYFDNEPNPKFGAKYLGRCGEVNDFLVQNNVNRLYCALPSVMKDTILSIISFCDGSMVRFYSVPNLSNYYNRRVNLELLGTIPVLSVRTEPLSQLDSRIVKRLFDVIFSSLFLVTLFPIIFVIFGTLIKLSSSGPIFFKQKRHGLDGKEFWCYKFRSMKVNIDADTIQASLDDPRKTKVGDFMRKTSIDELPQFFNVLMGSMSVVGPRPHMLKHTEEYSQLISTYMVRHLVKPGVTGWAQVTGFRGETKELSEMEGRVKADIWYMEHWTFMLDLYIIYKTVANVVTHSDEKAF